MQKAPNLGALGVTFMAMRAMQFMSVVAVIGLSANFVSVMVSAGEQPADVLVGTLVVVCVSLQPSLEMTLFASLLTPPFPQACIATVYVTITYILYHDSQLPLLLTSGLDTALLIALIVVAVTVGKPLSYLSCPTLERDFFVESLVGAFSSSSDGVKASRVSAIMSSSVGFLVSPDSPLGAQTACYELKAVWGLAVALCVLFAFSAIVLGCLWKRVRSAAAAEATPSKDIEG